MATRYLGGIVSATQPTPTQSSASGVWTVKEAEYYQKANNWPSGSGADPYFNYTTLLLNGDGTNGAQNNTFLDSSTNNFTITRNGNTTQGSFDPYVGPGCWGNFFNGTTDYLTATTATTFPIGTESFTVEMWLYKGNAWNTANQVLLCSAVANTFQLWVDAATNSIKLSYQGSTTVLTYSAASLSTNTWYHLAVVRNGNAFAMYVNGAQVTTATDTGSFATPASIFIANYFSGTTAVWNGYISNLRIVRGAALYTSAFTALTAPLIATTQTTLLTCNNNGFNDLSGGNISFTRSGTPQVSKFSPFTLYQTVPASYSGYFDGTGDYLSLPTSAGLQLGSSDFTFETWVYFSDVSADRAIIYWNANSTGYAALHVKMTGTKWALWISTSGSAWAVQQSALGSTVVAGQWYHVAVVRSSTNVKMYVNGSDVTAGGYTVSGSLMTTYTLNQIGVYNTSSYYMLGSMSNIRITNNVVYSSNFTPPTSPLTAVSGTALLTCQSTTFIDNSTNAFTITANGNATPKRANPFTDTVTGPTPYSTTTYGGSAYFDGTGDYLGVASNAAFAFGTGDFTIECWFLTTSSGVYQRFWWFGDDNDNTNISVGNAVQFGGASQTTITGSTIYTNNWYHLAYVRSSGSGKLYLNGAQVGSTTANSYNSSARTFYIGATGAGANPFFGYISNLRIVKGTAVYTGPFVPSAAPVTAVTNTQLLVNATNGGIFDNTTINDLETVGGAQISTSVVKYGTGSISFNGTNSYLFGPNTPNLDFGSGNFTIEGWFYTTSVATNGLISKWNDGGNQRGWKLDTQSAGTMTFYYSTTGSDFPVVTFSGASLDANTWTHLALVRNGSTLTLYKNGTSIGSSAFTATIFANTSQSCIGGWFVSTGTPQTVSVSPYNGYMDDIRITKGVARYTANFTPPAGPFPNY